MPGSRPTRAWSALAGGALLLVSACGIAPSPPAPTPKPIATSAAPTSQPGTERDTVRRTPAQLSRALLSARDVPPPLRRVDSEDPGGDAVVSRRPACRPLVRLLNSDGPAGALVDEDVSFAGGADGPWVRESAAALGSEQAATGAVEALASAVRACDAVTLNLPGDRSELRAQEVPSQRLGDRSFTARFTASTGAYRGFDLRQVRVAVDDVVISLTFLQGHQADVTAATRDAVAKARTVLRAPGSA